LYQAFADNCIRVTGTARWELNITITQEVWPQTQYKYGQECRGHINEFTVPYKSQNGKLY